MFLERPSQEKDGLTGKNWPVKDAGYADEQSKADKGEESQFDDVRPKQKIIKMYLSVNDTSINIEIIKKIGKHRLVKEWHINVCKDIG
jgi:hypothetical protein